MKIMWKWGLLSDSEKIKTASVFNSTIIPFQTNLEINDLDDTQQNINPIK